MAIGGERMLAKRLTRSTKAGVPYTRRPEIEHQLDELVRASAGEQLARAKATDHNSLQYIADECLVYLIWEAGLADNSERYHILAALLLKRVTNGIQRKLLTLGVAADDVDDMHQEVVLAMVTSILDGPNGEYYQMRFRSALYRQLLKSYDGYARHRRRAKRYQSINAPVQSSGDEVGEGDTTFGELLESGEDVAADVERRLLFHEALDAISNPNHRKAFVLHHYNNWPIESTDPAAPTLSQLFNRTPRMIRNWLTTADRQLAEWRAAKRIS